jgi:hypothetical protein
MPRKKGARFSAKEDRQAAHIAASEKASGKSSETAKRIGFATVVSRGGGKKAKRKKS